MSTRSAKQKTEKDEETRLTKSDEDVKQEEAADEDKPEEDGDDEEEGGDEEEEEASAPNTPSSAAAQAMQAHPMPPFYPYPYPPYPGMMPHGYPAPPAAGDSPGYADKPYTDAASMPDPPPDTRRNRGGVTEPFPEKLHRMLETTEREGQSDVVSFFSHGRAFAIHKPRRFVSEIMHRFFRQTRLTSFQRQLNLYGFRRISQGPDNGGYYHELFLKGRTGLCVNMKRTKVKGTSKIKRDVDNEPNFYAMPPVSGRPAPAGAGAPQAAAPFPPPYPPYGYPPGYPMPSAPYTAAQTGVPPPMYPYPPFYGYPPGAWGPMPPQQAPYSPSRGSAPASAPTTPADGTDAHSSADEHRTPEDATAV